jgi:hypothetical protein
MEEKVTGVSGKRYLIERNKKVKCLDCSFFRSCWNQEEYDKENR